ncbi:MAG: site-specific DNA-methyltransferase [Candidatus Limiplasma sp.]|jgi:adenine-specific DNA-methyltransferase|nr:site-specific DNA-methyltransferase [Candidatus Limiplasma sp.]
MPILNWIGKDKVINHHLDVPFRVLDLQYTFAAGQQEQPMAESENKIIRGDNLEALKALLPRYEGKIKCIYIDPPYNTGNEGWVYNDNVNDPKFRKWLGQVVGKEGEDLSRHDKWLCMMYPRLKLLQRLLAPDGAIFISIDDNEQANLKLICDEIFGATCFVSNVSWQRTYSTRNDSKGIVNEVEHMLVYSKQPNWNPNKLPRTEAMDAKYKNPDNDVKPWTSSDPFAADASTHQGMVYAIQHPFTGEMIYPSTSAHWRYKQDDMLTMMQGWCNYELRDLHDEHERAKVCGVLDSEVRQDVLGIVLSEPLEISAKNAKQVYKRGQWPRFFFTKGGKGGIRRKTYLDNVGGRLVTNLWQYNEVGHTDEAKKEMLALFDGKALFDTPKPTRLIEFVLKVASDSNSIILDSFAGSGTTAHAVLNLNKQDGGNRRFILVEMEDYAQTTTAERVRRVMQGYGDGNSAVSGTDGDFSFYDLGEPLLIGDMLNPHIPTPRIREYVYYMETKTPMQGNSQKEPYLLGVHRQAAYYFVFEPHRVTVLDDEMLATVQTHAEEYVIYADRCALGQDEMSRLHITFKKIPRDITRL